MLRVEVLGEMGFSTLIAFRLVSKSLEKIPEACNQNVETESISQKKLQVSESGSPAVSMFKLFAGLCQQTQCNLVD